MNEFTKNKIAFAVALLAALFTITPILNEVSEVFPYDKVHKWTEDNFGPLWVPAKGASLILTPENYTLYERVIRV